MLEYLNSLFEVSTDFDVALAQYAGVLFVIAKVSEYLNKKIFVPRRDKNLFFKTISKALDFIGLHIKVKKDDK